MNVSYNWLKNYIKTEHSPQRLCEILTDTGLEVEGLEKVEGIKGGLKGVVIGQVTSCVKHENADRLKVTNVNINEDQELQIVCGAPNIAEGQKVLVATVGTTLYPQPDEPFKIKKSKIRGVESYGMICAEDELGMGTSHDGIWVLPENAKVGQNAAEYFKLEDDYRIEIGLTPNRSDALGHVGVARDIVAFSKVNEKESISLKMPDVNDYQVSEKGTSFRISVQSPEACNQFRGCIISNLKVQSSPDWLKKYLLAIGLAPINNVVDVTNFVMYELGTPLHAYDMEHVGNEIVVKNAREGEDFITLDGTEHSLSENDLMITNGKVKLGIAGIFGGQNSGVSEQTTSIFLEAAYFNPVNVRKSAKRHGLSTDASFRFERGVDPSMIEFAMKRAAILIARLGDGNISSEPVPFEGKEVEPNEIMFNYDNCNRLIGHTIDRETIGTILSALEIETIQSNQGTVKLRIPSYRVDVTREADVIEEVLRIYGYNNVALPKKWNVSLSNQDLRSEEQRKNTIANLLVDKGYFEIMNNSLTSSSNVENHGGKVFSNKHSVEMLNPLSKDLDVLRQSLIYQGLKSIVQNVNRQNPDVGLFEFGKVYQKFNTEEYLENKRLTIFLTGAKEPEQWNGDHSSVSFYSLKGIVNAVLERLGLSNMVTSKGLGKSILEDGVQLYIQKHKIGEMGWTSLNLNKSIGLKQMSYVADLDWDKIIELGNRNKVQYKTLPKAFAIRRDFSLLINNEVSFGEIEEIAYKANRTLLKEVNLFDVYEGSKLPEGKKSYAVSFNFQDNEKTLKDSQVDQIMEKIRKQLEQRLHAELR